MDVRAALKGQYHAALLTLKHPTEQCPDWLWAGGPHPVPFWQVVYHTLYYTHLYLQQSEQEFVPWEHHREGCQSLPWPPDSGPKLDHPYSKSQMLDYWRIVDGRVNSDVDKLDLESPDSGISWYKNFPKFEHQIMNIRHVQHHAAILSARLRTALGNKADFRWMRSDGKTYEG